MPATTTASTSADIDRLMDCEEGSQDSHWDGERYPSALDAQTACLAHWLWADGDNEITDVQEGLSAGLDVCLVAMKVDGWTWPAMTTDCQARQAWHAFRSVVDAGASYQSDHVR